MSHDYLHEELGGVQYSDVVIDAALQNRRSNFWDNIEKYLSVERFHKKELIRFSADLKAPKIEHKKIHDAIQQAVWKWLRLI